MIIASILLVLIGIFIIFSGFLIKKKGNTSFIAGNNQSFLPNNEIKLAKRIGWVVIVFGVETLVFPILFNYVKIIEGYHLAILAVIHLILVFIFMLVDQIGIRK